MNQVILSWLVRLRATFEVMVRECNCDDVLALGPLGDPQDMGPVATYLYSKVHQTDIMML